MTNECKHGQLKRQCPTCELEEEMADLKHDIGKGLKTNAELCREILVYRELLLKMLT